VQTAPEGARRNRRIATTFDRAINFAQAALKCNFASIEEIAELVDRVREMRQILIQALDVQPRWNSDRVCGLMHRVAIARLTNSTRE